MTRIKGSIVIKIVALIFYFLMAFFLAKAQVTSDFSVDADGWSSIVVSASQSYTPTYNSTGGNLGGCISVDLINPTSLFYFYADRSFDAPAKFLGNKSFSYNQNLTFDLQQSLAGADASAAEVMISGGGITIFFPVSSFPSTTSWTNYSVSLKETAGWKTGSLTGAATSKTEMKQVLANIVSLRIRAQYFPSFPAGSYSCKLDNVVLNSASLPVTPTITSFNPASGVPGTAVTITGTNFNSLTTKNVVYFNGAAATVTSATATQLIVTSPSKITYGPITVVNTGLGTQATSRTNFNPLFDNNKDFGGRVIASSFGKYTAFGTAPTNPIYQPSGFSVGDLDGDGWQDVLTSRNDAGFLYAQIFRNKQQTGGISASSFASAFTLTLPNSPVSGAVLRVGQTAIADMDSDGKLDVIVNVGYNFGGNYDNSFVIFLNQSTPGNLAFASGYIFQVSTTQNNNEGIAVGDMDGDGRPELLLGLINSASHLGILQNLSTPGNLDFAYAQDFAQGATMGVDISLGDLNGDSKPEVLIQAYLSGAIMVYENTSVAGTISLAAPFNVSSNTTANIKVADLDNDGKNDIFFKDYAIGGPVRIKMNNHSSGALTAADFAAPITLMQQIGGSVGSTNSYCTAADVNGDNKVDIIIGDGTNIAVYQNNYTSGGLSASSFYAGTTFEGGNNSNEYVVCADIDGDNKPEILIRPSNTTDGFWVYHNESFPAPRIDTMTPSSGTVGASVNFTGDHFSTGLGFPPVVGRLGKIAAAILPSSNTLASGIVTPSISGRFSFTEHGLTAFSKPFSVLFGTTQIINSSSFGPSVDFPLAINLRDALDVADFDDDGGVDVAVIDNFSSAKIFKNSQGIPGQAIALTSLTVQGTTYAAGYNLIALDIDGDGKIDLNSGGGLLQNTSTSGTISFANSVGSAASGFTASSSADFNKDGKIDLVFTGGNIQVYENLSRNGAFTSNGSLFQNFGGGAINLTIPSTSTGVVAADFDNDGFDDIISVNSSTSNSTYYLNNQIAGGISSSSFSFLGNYSVSGLQPYDVTANDFDGDGKIDIAITYYNSSFVSVLLNNSSLGDISFIGTDVPVANKGYKITSQDLDGDGKVEIVVIHQPNPGPGSFTVLQNKCSVGSVSFTATNFSINRNPQAVNIADINGDRKPDILIAANGGPGNALMVFENKIAFTPPYNNKIFYSRADATVWATSGDGSPDQFIANGSWPRLSPDGRYLFYHKGSTVTNFKISTYKIDLITGTETLIFSNTTDYTVYGSWSQDGSKIFFDFSCGIQSMNSDGTGASTIDSSGGCYDDSPDVRSDGLIVLHNTQPGGGLLTMNSDGSNRQLIPNTLPNDQFARWSPDGQWITFTRSSVTPFVQYKIKPDGSGLTALTNLAAGETLGGLIGYMSAWLTDGSAIIMNGKIGCQNGIFKIPADGSKVIQRLAMPSPISNPDMIGSVIGAPPLTFLPLYTDPTISSFSPATGLAGTTVTLTGTNFDLTPANNIVKFNGTTAVVTASSATSITTTVPAGATTGNITVLTSCNAGVSGSAFTVGSPSSITINTQPSPVYSVCDGAIPTISTAATGTTNITYQWQIFNAGSSTFVDLTNTSGYSNVSTSSLTINSSGNFGTGTYRCKINGDLATTVYTNTVSFSVNAIPSVPTVSNISNCGPGSLVLTASGTANGNYLWYDTNGLIVGQTNSTYTTPAISSTSSYLVRITNGTCVSPQVSITATINSVPATPSTSNVSNCGSTSFTLTASGGSNGNYLWYDTNGLISGQVNSTYVTPFLSSTTAYSVAITNGVCNSTKANITATINTVPVAPTTQGASQCSGSTFSLAASGGTNGQYVWYTTSSGGSGIPGEVNSTYVTPATTANTTYYVSINNGLCESARTSVTATVITSGCSIPVITPAPLTTQVGGSVSLNLISQITTINGNLSISSIVVTKQPPSGAVATVNNGVLTVDYSGITFSGTEEITIQACDTNGNCATQIFKVTVVGDIVVYNGISPNGQNPAFIIEYINLIPETKGNTVHIFDRWENLVWHGTNYDNQSVVFTGVSDSGKDLPSGVYYYKISFASDRKTETGFISLRRQ